MVVIRGDGVAMNWIGMDFQRFWGGGNGRQVECDVDKDNLDYVDDQDLV